LGLLAHTGSSQAQPGLLLGNVGDKAAGEGLWCAGQLRPDAGTDSGPGDGRNPGEGSKGAESGLRENRSHGQCLSEQFKLVVVEEEEEDYTKLIA